MTRKCQLYHAGTQNSLFTSLHKSGRTHRSDGLSSWFDLKFYPCPNVPMTNFIRLNREKPQSRWGQYLHNNNISLLFFSN